MQPAHLLYHPPKPPLPVLQSSERVPYCFGKEFDRSNTSCMGGFDLDFTDDERGNIRPACSYAARCAGAMGDKEPTPSPDTDIVVPKTGLRRVDLGTAHQPSMASPFPSDRSVMYPGLFPTPTAAQAVPPPPAPAPATSTLPALGSPEWKAMTDRLFAAGKQYDDNAAAAAAARAPQPQPVAPPPVQQAQQPSPPPAAFSTPQAPIRPTFIERMARPAAVFANTMQQASMPLPAPPPAPYPGSPQYPSQVYGGATTYQLNYAMPGYLSSPEPRHPGESLWHVLARELFRAVGKALGHALAHFFDTRVFRPA